MLAAQSGRPVLSFARNCGARAKRRETRSSLVGVLPQRDAERAGSMRTCLLQDPCNLRIAAGSGMLPRCRAVAGGPRAVGAPLAQCLARGLWLCAPRAR